MSLLDQLNNAETSSTNAIFGAPTPKGLTPLDVSASALFANLNINLYKKTQVFDKQSHDDPVSPIITTYPNVILSDVDNIIYPDKTDPDTGYPIERGVVLDAGVIKNNVVGVNNKYNTRNNNDILFTDVPAAYSAFNDDVGYEFLRNLDRGYIPKNNDNGSVYLTTYTETNPENEDPISFGYDIVINYVNSPLFNGAVEDFINSYPNYTELYSKSKYIKLFKEQFFRFFNVDSVNSLGEYKPDNVARTYYLKRLSGLANLTENISSEKSKQFIDYKKDVITLSLYEDVSVNMGYLATVYKMLTWSKVNGKKMIPENLLKFDCDIVVSESRKFNRVIKNADGTLTQFADTKSKFRYKLYECQFFFDKLSHPDEIDMSNLDYTNSFDIKFNYKFATLKFEEIDNAEAKIDTTYSNNPIKIGDVLDNAKTDLSVDPIDGETFTIEDGKFVISPVTFQLYSYAPTVFNNTIVDNFATRLQNLDRTLLNGSNKMPNLRELLLQKTLSNINDKFGFNLNNILNSIGNNLKSGFTEDGYEYNIPAHYLNKLYNTFNNTLFKAVSTIKRDIYQQGTLYVESSLMPINNGIDKLNNIINNGINNAFNTYPGSSGKTKDIYGSGPKVVIPPSGDQTPNPEPTFTPGTDKSGFGKDVFELNIDAYNKNHPYK